MSTYTLSLIAAFFCSTALALSPAVEPLTPDEISPAGLEEVPVQVAALIQNVSALPAKVAATGGGSVLTIPELQLLQGGLTEYKANRQTCISDQIRAANFCREETSPDLQKTLSGINLILAAANTVAVKDACSSFSKAISLAQLGLTGYTATCGILRKKCNLSCASAADGLKKIIQGLTSGKATCTPGTNPTACPEGITQLKALKEQIYVELKKEISLTDKRSIHSKEKLCQHTYGLLLISAGASIFSLANSLKEGQQCEDQSSGEKSSPATTSATATSSPATPVVANTSSASETKPAATSTMTVVAPAEVITPITTTTAPAIETKHALNANSELREYLPGGSKAVPPETPAHPDITAPDGKSNFQKMRIRFQELGLDRD